MNAAKQLIAISEFAFYFCYVAKVIYNSHKKNCTTFFVFFCSRHSIIKKSLVK